ncbi:MAG: flagellar export chaperone FlgN [Acidobacteria bacterium]|nr:flagellar export chaperone FlgN [Acidobacteriota bacterium]
MSTTVSRYFDILDIMLVLIRALADLGAQKKVELIGGRYFVAMALQEREEACIVKLRIVQDELERVAAALGGELNLSGPARVADLRRGLSGAPAQRLREFSKALTREARRLRCDARANGALMTSTARFSNALLGEIARSEGAGYGERGGMAVPRAASSLVSGQV